MRSMTGFGRGRASSQGYAVQVDLRSLNGRFREVRVRGLGEFPRLAALVEAQVLRAFERGTFEVHVRWDFEGEPHPKRLLFDVARRYHQQLSALQGELGLPDPPSLAHLLELGAFQEDPAVEESLLVPLEQAIRLAVAEVQAQREREGAELRAALVREVNNLRALLVRAESQAPEAIHAAEARLRARLAELQVDPDPGRLAAELVLWAERGDVREELDRIQSHLGRLETLLDSPGPIGKELEFIAQELARETGTLSAKARSTALAQTALQMRLGVDRLREQGRNVE